MNASACLAASWTCVLYFALAFPAPAAKSSDALAAPVNQGCVNQGSDPLMGATVVCWRSAIYHGNRSMGHASSWSEIPNARTSAGVAALTGLQLA